MIAQYKTCEGILTLTNVGDGLLLNEKTGECYEQRLCKVAKVHLKDFGMNKTTLWSSFKAEEHIGYEGVETDRELLQRKTQWYTLEEMKTLIGLMTTSHDWCIYDNQSNTAYSHHTDLQIYQANQKFARKEKAEKKLTLLLTK